ncbi:MAG TPA: 30S ribosome-binding factor RbfA [Gemmatimonas aurantiaca]|uniref:Ribosome-binding factor A n=2 Tax=Gemmatimonas aurantiaca TaxID=173480 RepID=RBFA_GEMAT|nr:30S ribosome-binding factor RbfA [Gemmatimonas aurantiaca]C1A8N9.1 RecName: Full=Ribosome-binding factor A [Gemmatimonas aurantiaca T-27]BAH38599.1 ribosome-binding factor A [Gemmatimonas aurantiaca T-27]HCT57279.1 30S ribosome-binding factor RbfA [Gemmatimonas aurantiaca]
MGEVRRPDRVAEAIREEVATFLSEGAKDPRIRAFVTVTAVEVTRDLRHATVFVSLMGDDADKKSTTAGLASVASHLRSQLGKSLRLRSAPEIHFRTDESVARASRIEHLLAKIRDEREAQEPAQDPAQDSSQDASVEASDAPDKAE